MINRSVLGGLVLSLGVFASARAEALSPPWWSMQRVYAYSYGASPCLVVDDLVQQGEARYLLRIHACTQETADALASLLRLRWNLGGVRLIVKVFGPGSSHADAYVYGTASAEQLRERLENALNGNPYLAEIREVIDPMTQKAKVFVVCTKEVIQFWDDNLGDLFGNHNLVAAEAFRQVTKKNFKGSRKFGGWSTRADK